MSVFRRFFENVAVVSDVGHERHDEFFANRVDRRIRDLGEELVEAVEKRTALMGAARESGVVAHRSDRFFAVAGHRFEDEIDILLRIVEALLPSDEVSRHLRGDDFGEKSLDFDVVFLDPAPIGAATGVAGLDLGVFDQAVLREVEENHRTRFDTTVADDVFRFDVQNARLRGEDEKIVLGERPARGSESVAVQCGSGGDAVGECHRRRTVPRFHQGGMVFVEAAYVVSHVVFLAPGLRHQHQHRVGGIATCRHKKFEDIVERGGIGLAVVDKRQHRFEIFPEECRRQGLLACAELIEVAADGVDFAVVREHPERMGELPGRKGVRRVALMDECEGGGEIALGEVRIESLDLRSEQESFIDDGSRGEGADVSVFQPLLDHAAKYESSALVGSLDE